VGREWQAALKHLAVFCFGIGALGEQLIDELKRAPIRSKMKRSHDITILRLGCGKEAE
jgi:hypothetical protein